MSYAGDQPRVFLLNLETGQRETVGDFPGMTFAPRFSPDGQRVVMSLQKGGNSAIYEMDLRSAPDGGSSRRAMRIDTSPSYSPDGRQIVFETDRDGTQEIYVMNSDGSSRTASAAARAATRRRSGRRAATTSPLPSNSAAASSSASCAPTARASAS